jgi:ParB-like chromosome segregation protein Spo0J
MAPHHGRYTNHQPCITIPYNPLILNKKEPKKPPQKPKIDWFKKALEYQKVLTTGLVKSQAELSRKEGVSRARITQLLNLLKLPQEIKDHLDNITDEKQLEIFTERQMREILKIKDQKIQIARFNQMLSKADKRK